MSRILKNIYRNDKKRKQKIIEIGSERIPKSRKFSVLTHCHSSVVTGILLKAKEQGKNFRVFCTETRPRFQGYITAQTPRRWNTNNAGCRLSNALDGEKIIQST